MTNLGEIYPNSIVEEHGTRYFMVREGHEKQLGIQGDRAGFSGQLSADGETFLCPLSPENAALLRTRLAWLNPVAFGSHTSFGFGDRMGTATPGHIQALNSLPNSGQIAPIFAQQSVRENTRLGRTPQQVLEAAIWGIFQSGWRGAWGADADHVKEVSDLPNFIAAGYSFFTIDPSDHVDNAAQTDTLDTLRGKAAGLPWDSLHTSYEAALERYCQQPHQLNGLTLTFDEETILRALVKYGRALAHTLTIANALKQGRGDSPFDIEMSVDETDTPTSPHEHFYIANELKRCGIPVVSLAPRFVGKFQKGVDYMGDLAVFEAEFIQHVAIMQHFGGYKLSIHTGSDKFSIYPIIAKHVKGQVHVKTAGTSYLEALRVISQLEPALFRRILGYASQQFEKDRKTYYLDAKLENIPADSALSDADLPPLLDQFDARQVLHVAFGSVLTHFGAEIRPLLDGCEDLFYAGLSGHFQRHLSPFC